MNKTHNKSIWRCVDWGTDKAEERFKKGKNRVDPYILNMSLGTNGIYMNDEKLDLDDGSKEPCIFRGLGKSPHIHKCIEKEIPFMYIDTGYFGNSHTKKWHRVAYNNLQTLNHKGFDKVRGLLLDGIGNRKFKDIMNNRFPDCFGVQYDNWQPNTCPRGEKILVVPPSQKVFNHFGGDAEIWTKKLLEEIPKHTDREIVVREKLGRSARVSYTLEDQLMERDYHCVVTFNSIASLESVVRGIPAITLGPNAGSYLSDKHLSNIELPYFPDDQTIREHVFYLFMCQFTGEEMQSILTKRIIEILQGDEVPLKFKI